MFKIKYRVEGSEEWTEMYYLKKEDALRWLKILDREETSEYIIYEGQWTTVDKLQ